jgi:hypothetical protein
MISPIDSLIVMFFKWGMDMLSNITVASNAQCMKFKLLDDNFKRTKLLICSNQQVYLPVLTEEEKQQLERKHYVISQQWMIDKSRSCWGQDNYAKPRCDQSNNFRKWDMKKFHQKVMEKNNKCFVCRKEFEKNNPLSPNRID